MFLNQVILHDGIPFEIRKPKFNAETIQVMEDTKKGRNVSKSFNSVDEMFNTQIDDSIKKLEGKDPETANLFKNLICLICEIVVASDESLAGAEKELAERIKRYLD